MLLCVCGIRIVINGPQYLFNSSDTLSPRPLDWDGSLNSRCHSKDATASAAVLLLRCCCFCCNSHWQLVMLLLLLLFLLLLFANSETFRTMQDNFSATCQNNLRPKESSRILDQTEGRRERESSRCCCCFCCNTCRAIVDLVVGSGKWKMCENFLNKRKCQGAKTGRENRQWIHEAVEDLSGLEYPCLSYKLITLQSGLNLLKKFICF